MSGRARPTRAVRETVSFRLPGEVLERLDLRASLLGTTRTTLAEQYLERQVTVLAIAARYYAAFPQEIDARIRANEAAAAREQELAEAQRRLLG